MKKTTKESKASLAKDLKSNKIIIGTDRVIKSLRAGKLSKIYISLNCKDSIKSDISHYSKLGDVEVISLKVSNEELGILCKKPFSISVLGLAG
ncbi:MAG: ribosomal L7Ae/L30e/S12e/Gadd45 family protein [Candidatus Woesearchaeota archaeon]|jgi:large subunit ribosomal protein L30e|nr:ribosomal L7Ae/L30e/S12e/Gadd45 family protein [Candidatus Woesearchaeota archaeon]|tara:strand:+ start:434 stop:712 length:279 start_codon:yes stop_codon:yes gene_type:complete